MWYFEIKTTAMEPNKHLSNKAFLDYVTGGTFKFDFDRNTTTNDMVPLNIEGEELFIELKGKSREISINNHGHDYINYEVAIMLFRKKVFHFHSRIVVKNISNMIFEDKVAIYVRP